MYEHPHVQALLQFEQQRLKASIVVLDAVVEEHDTKSVVLRRPSTLDVVATAALTHRDPSAVELRTCKSPHGTTPHSRAGVVVACTAGHVVHLCIDPEALADDPPLLSELWNGVAEALSEAAAHVAKHLEQAEVATFIDVEERVWREALRRLPGEIDSLDYAVSRLEGQMREQGTRLFELRCRYRALQVALPEAVRQAATEQHAMLRRLVPNLYRQITVSDGAIVADLGPVVIEHDDAEVEVGEFEVWVDLASGDVSIRNRSNVVNGIHHPHVRSPQDVCWGNVRGSIARLAAEREWAALLIATQRFLVSFTEGDAYQSLSAWDPNHSEDDDDYQDDDEDEGADTETCTLCLDSTASDEITWVRDEPVCLACYERDVFTCACCRRQFTSREQARESTQCTGCWEASHFTCPACQGVKPVGERAVSGACATCMASGGWRVAPAPTTQEAAS